jgi:hypothetical protein
MANERHKRDRVPYKVPFSTRGIGWNRHRFDDRTEWTIWREAANGTLFVVYVKATDEEMFCFPDCSFVAWKLRSARKQLREAIARNGGPLKTSG